MATPYNALQGFPSMARHHRSDRHVRDLRDLLVGEAFHICEEHRHPEVLGDRLERRLHVGVGDLLEHVFLAERSTLLAPSLSNRNHSSTSSGPRRSSARAALPVDVDEGVREDPVQPCLQVRSSGTTRSPDRRGASSPEQILGVGGVPRHPQRSSVEAGEQRAHPGRIDPGGPDRPVPAPCSRSPSDDQYPWCAAVRFAGRHNYKAVGRLGHARARPQTVRTPPRSGLSTATAEIGTGRRARGGRLPGAVQRVLTQAASTPVPFSEFRRRSTTATCKRSRSRSRPPRSAVWSKPRMEPRPTWRRSRPVRPHRPRRRPRAGL